MFICLTINIFSIELREDKVLIIGLPKSLSLELPKNQVLSLQAPDDKILRY